MSFLPLLAAFAGATTLSERSTVTLEPGVTLTEYRASSPSTDVWVLRVDLCADNVYVDATRETDSYQTTGAWAESLELTAATNEARNTSSRSTATAPPTGRTTRAHAG